MAFMPFVTAGDPDMPTTVDVLRELARRGVDLIEIGFPYSDPIADGPVIQASYQRALDKKLHVDDIFRAIGDLTAADGQTLPPLVAMVSYALIFRMGAETFAKRAARAGFAGLIIPDLPADEAGSMTQTAAAAGLDLVALIAPTTTASRTTMILQASRGFLYCIAVAGTTGVRQELPAPLRDQLRSLKSQTTLPLAVGFGISRPEQVAELKGLADGIIVGSAFVKRMASLADPQANRPAILQELGDFASSMLAATRAKTPS